MHAPSYSSHATVEHVPIPPHVYSPSLCRLTKSVSVSASRCLPPGAMPCIGMAPGWVEVSPTYIYIHMNTCRQEVSCHTSAWQTTNRIERSFLVDLDAPDARKPPSFSLSCIFVPIMRCISYFRRSPSPTGESVDRYGVSKELMRLAASLFFI